MDQIILLWSFEDEIGVLGEEGGKCNFHFPNHLYFIRQLIADKVLDIDACVKRTCAEKVRVSGEDDFEGVVRWHFHILTI